MANRQTLIHLHGTGRLADASKLNLGEIAVRNAANAADTELAVLTSDKALVYIPSIDKVEGITNPISTKVSTLETTVGDEKSGLVKKVADLEVALGEGGSVTEQITSAIEKLDATVGDATVAEGKHVAVQVIEQDGIITAVNVNEDDIASATVLSGVDTRLIAAEGAIEGLLEGENSVTEQITSAIEKLDATIGSTTVAEGKHVAVQVIEQDGKITAVNVNEDDIASASVLSGVANTVGDANGGLVKKVADLEVALGEGGSVASQITSAIEGLDATVGSTTVAEGKHVAVQVIEQDGKITAVNVNEDDIASASVLSGVSSKVTKLIGSDTDMSARAIVQDEVAKQLKSENITESFDTLKEMAEYLSSHPQTVTDMNTAISGNTNNILELQQTLSGYSPENTVASVIGSLSTTVGDEKSGLVKKVADLEVALGEGGSVASQITSAIEGLDATVGSTTVAEGKHVAVQVIEQDGKITAVNVNEDDIASASALSTVANTVGDANGGLVKKVADLEVALGEGGSVASQITSAIEGLDATVGSTTVAEGKHVAVQVIEQDGKITAVNVNEDDIASASVLSGVKTTADTAVQTISVKAAETGLTANGITATKTGTNVEFNFNNMVIDCGTY